jgi:CRISPR-associated protein
VDFGGRAGGADLVVASIRGVQSFIAEARSTADLHAGSAIISELSIAMVAAVQSFRPEGRLVMPSAGQGGSGTPNRIVALAPSGCGQALAQHLSDAARDRWRAWADAISAAGGREAEATPGFPDVQWVVVSGDAGDGYAGQWERASAGLARRKRIRSFGFPAVGQARVCSLTGRWAAVPDSAAPKGAWNVRSNEALSVVAHAKRMFSRDDRNRFPSTWSVATAPYRAAIIAAAADDEGLRAAVASLREYVNELLGACSSQDKKKMGYQSVSPLGIPATQDEDLAWLRSVEGAWCTPSTWDPAGLKASYDLSELPEADTCDLVRMAAGDLARESSEHGLVPLTPYLAVVAQDADHLGERLAEFPVGTDPAGWHQQVSDALREAAVRQREVVERAGTFGRVIYAGGDDLLALTPSATALSCVRDVNAAFRDRLSEWLPDATASAAIVYFHASWPLQSAVTAVQKLLKEAKQAGRPGLGLAVLRRGGERSRLVLPWWDPDDAQTPMADHVATLAASMAGSQAGLSGRLASELERDSAALRSLGPEWLKRELLRRNARHGGPEAGDALLSLGYEGPSGRRVLPAAAVSVARFLAAEAVAAGPGALAGTVGAQ